MHFLPSSISTHSPALVSMLVFPLSSPLSYMVFYSNNTFNSSTLRKRASSFDMPSPLASAYIERGKIKKHKENRHRKRPHPLWTKNKKKKPFCYHNINYTLTFFLFCISSIFSSTDPLMMSRLTITSSACPNRCTRSIACASTAKFHHGSYINTILL